MARAKILRHTGAAGRAAPPEASWRGPWCWRRRLRGQSRVADERTSGRAGNSPRCAPRASTPATALRMALEAGRAMPCGHWSGCHSASWGPRRDGVDIAAVHRHRVQARRLYARLMINLNGERFVDEERRCAGDDLRQKWAASSLAQPGQVAWQVLQCQTSQLPQRLPAAAIRPLPRRHAGRACGQGRRHQPGCLPARRPISFNRRCAATSPSTWARRTAAAFTEGLAIPKSTGRPRSRSRRSRLYRDLRHHLHLRRRPHRRHRAVMDVDEQADPRPPMPRGEMVGGVLYFNYPGGAGLMSAAVFGRLAGTSAAAATKEVRCVF